MQIGEEIRRPPFNGPANHIRQVVEELGCRGHDIKILFRLDGRIWISNDLKEFTPLTVARSDHGLLRFTERVTRRVQYELKLPYLGLFESLRFAYACCQALADRELFFERFSWMTYGGALASDWLRIPWVLEYNGDPLADLEAKGIAPRGLHRNLSIWLMNWALHQANHIVATGEGWRRSSIRDWSLAPEQVTTIENGTHLIHLLGRGQL
jgi:hypothetical protein